MVQWYPLWPPIMQMVGGSIPYPPALEKCAKGICLCKLLWSTQPNEQETVIDG